MVVPLVGALGSLGSRVGMRVGIGILEREATKKGLAAAARSTAAANPVPAATGRQLASGALTAAGAGSAAVGMGAALERGDYTGAVLNGAGALGGGGRLVGAALNSGRAGVGLGNFGAAAGMGGATNVALGTASASLGNTPRAQAAVPTGAREQGSTAVDPQQTTATAGAESAAGGDQQVPTVVTPADRRAVERDQLLGQNIAGLANTAGRNYQEITQDLRRLADRGPKQWDTSLRDMSEWEADNRRREIRMAYANHPIPGKGEGKVLEFDSGLQKRREALENSRINGFGQNVSAFDKSLAALGQANGQSVDMADKMFGQTAMRRGQDITAQKNLWDAQANDKSATAQLLTALGGVGGGGKGGKGESPYKSEKERLDYLKSLAETQYPDNPQGQKKLIDSVLLNSENGKAWDTLMQDGMPNVANELLTSMTDQTTYTPEQLAGATRSRFDLLGQLKGQWDDLGDSNKDNTTWFEPRYTIPGRSDSVNERTLANLKNQSVTDLVKQAVLNPTQQVNGMPFTYADFGGDEAAFQRAVMSHFQAAHQGGRHEKGS